MEMVIFIGVQASGKSSFYLQRFYRTHVRINKDMLKTRRREELLLQACLEGKTRFVIDKMNLTRAERAPYIARAKAARFKVIGVFFPVEVRDAISRNQGRKPPERVPDVAIYRSRKVLQPPACAEGFDRLFVVRNGKPLQ